MTVGSSSSVEVNDGHHLHQQICRSCWRKVHSLHDLESHYESLLDSMVFLIAVREDDETTSDSPSRVLELSATCDDSKTMKKMTRKIQC